MKLIVEYSINSLSLLPLRLRSGGGQPGGSGYSLRIWPLSGYIRRVFYTLCSSVALCSEVLHKAGRQL